MLYALFGRLPWVNPDVPLHMQRPHIDIPTEEDFIKLSASASPDTAKQMHDMIVRLLSPVIDGNPAKIRPSLDMILRDPFFSKCEAYKQDSPAHHLCLQDRQALQGHWPFQGPSSDAPPLLVSSVHL